MKMKWKPDKSIRRKAEAHKKYEWDFGSRIKNLGGHWHNEHSARLTTEYGCSLALNSFMGSGGFYIRTKANAELLRDILNEALDVWPDEGGRDD